MSVIKVDFENIEQLKNRKEIIKRWKQLDQNLEKCVLLLVLIAKLYEDKEDKFNDVKNFAASLDHFHKTIKNYYKKFA